MVFVRALIFNWNFVKMVTVELSGRGGLHAVRKPPRGSSIHAASRSHSSIAPAF